MWLYENESCKIKFLEDVQAVYIKWTGFPFTQDFRNACNKALKIMTNKGACKFLADNTDVLLFSEDDQKWLNDVWIPRAKAAGYKASAVLLKQQQILAQKAVKNIVSSRGDEFSARNFQSIEKAKDWLNNF